MPLTEWSSRDRRADDTFSATTLPFDAGRVARRFKLGEDPIQVNLDTGVSEEARPYNGVIPSLPITIGSDLSRQRFGRKRTVCPFRIKLTVQLLLRGCGHASQADAI
jgi:hypothetical protein